MASFKERRWLVPNKRTKSYAEERKAKVHQQKYPTYLENIFSAELAIVTKRFSHLLSTDEHFYATSLPHEPALFPFSLNSSSIHHKYQFVPR